MVIISFNFDYVNFKAINYTKGLSSRYTETLICIYGQFNITQICIFIDFFLF